MADRTDVIFRVFKDHGDVIALFPGLPGTNDPNTCQSYIHVGQHGAATTDLTKVTLPATPKQYWLLKAELERAGYSLRIVKRFRRSHFHQRSARY